MNLLMLTLDDYPHIGGKSTHIASLIDGLKYQDIECKIISRSDINRHKLNLCKIFIYPLKYINIKKYLYLRKMSEFCLFQKLIKRELKKNKYDWISCQDALACTAVGRLNVDSVITLTMHTYFGLEYTLDNGVFNLEDDTYKKLLALEEESLKYVTNVVGVDERIYKHVEETIKNKFISYTDKINLFSIINFTNTDLYNTDKVPHEDFNIMCIRRLVEKNGVIYLVKAMRYLKKEGKIKLHIYGDGPAKDEIIDYIEKNDLQNVIVHGAIANTLLPNIYKQCDLVVVPSITVNGLQEATSISAIEAMSCGIPVIASDIGGLSQMISDEENGLLVPEQSSVELAESIMKLYNDNKLQTKLSKNSRSYVLKNHSHIVAAQQYLDIFTNN